VHSVCSVLLSDPWLAFECASANSLRDSARLSRFAPSVLVVHIKMRRSVETWHGSPL
jgi:hypothetical protein